jgi:hypothetical protein
MRGEVRLPADKKGQEAWEIGRSRRKPQSNVGAPESRDIFNSDRENYGNNPKL